MFNFFKLKKKFGITFLVSCLLGACSSSSGQLDNEVAPVELKVGEGQNNLIGYYESAPRFSWKVDKQASSKFQSAYQIQVSSNFDETAEFTADLWDSGKVTSATNAWVRYQGKELVSRQKVYWRVKTWDESDKNSNWSEVNHFELGLLNQAQWQGKWINHPDTSLDNNPSQAVIATPQYLRKEFKSDKSVQQARLYITAKGLFKAYINGAMIAPEDAMTPGWTPYSKRIETLTYDVTDLVNSGQNVLAANLAGGWYSGRVYKFTEREHKLTPQLLAQLEISYADGTTKRIVTDETWLSTQQGPIRFASIYDGEKYDQNYEIPNWHTTNFNASNWTRVDTAKLDQKLKLTPKRHKPIRNIQALKPVSIVKHTGDTVIFDFGQNMVGVPKINLPAVAGKQIKIRFAEALHKGEFYTDNYRSAVSTNYYLPSTTGVIEYQPTFTYHGYRYIEISGFDPAAQPRTDWAQALVQHTDFKVSNNFKSSAPKLNQLASNVKWGLKSNFYDIPLDCPQRDERLGWTGDAQVFASSSMHVADVYAFWAAWLESVRDDQMTSGGIPLYVPFVDWINWPSSGWGDAATIIPWELYMLTGDSAILADNYEMMQGWVKYHQSQSKDYVSSMKTFGDWLQPYPDETAKNPNRGDTDFNLISTAYFARSVELTLKTAKVLAKEQDIEALEALYQNVKKAFRNNFFNADLSVKSGHATQTSYLLALAFDLFDAKDKKNAQTRLLGLIKDADNHLRTGFLGTPLLADVLQEAGRSDLVYELLFKESYPSWFYSINNGATTTWERWNSYSLEDGFNPQGMNSLNHYAYGSIAEWFYQGILGIKPLTPGFSSVLIEPQIGTKLTTASGFYDTPQGQIYVSWETKGKFLKLVVKIPKNTQAQLVLPKHEASSLTLMDTAHTKFELDNLQAGEYKFSMKLTSTAK
nr:alpha-L-rhamnosidase [Catenovulum maritimum]